MGLLDRKYEVNKILAKVFYRVPSDILSHRERARLEKFFSDVYDENLELREQVKKLKQERDRYQGEVEELGRILDEYEG